MTEKCTGHGMARQGVAGLGFGPAIIDRSSRLYRCDDVPAICDALCARITHARDAWIKGRSTAEPVVVEAAQ